MSKSSKDTVFSTLGSTKQFFDPNQSTKFTSIVFQLKPLLTFLELRFALSFHIRSLARGVRFSLGRRMSASSSNTGKARRWWNRQRSLQQQHANQDREHKQSFAVQPLHFVIVCKRLLMFYRQWYSVSTSLVEHIPK